MTSFEIYNLFLCVFVFIGFTGVFGFMLRMLVKSSLKCIRNGLDDESIKTEYEKAGKLKKFGVVDLIISITLCTVVLSASVFSAVVSLMPDKVSGNIPTIRVVNSGSMASKYRENTYLFENDLNDQFETFDLILTYALPPEDELKLYDIVVYEIDRLPVVHRIVGIEEPNEKHPNERYFLLQGDAVSSPDRFPVLYEQMKAIYRGEKIPFVDSFVAFMQSPAGWLCIILIVFAVSFLPVLESKFEKEKKARLIIMGILTYIKETVKTQSCWLMNLEIQAN